MDYLFIRDFHTRHHGMVILDLNRIDYRPLTDSLDGCETLVGFVVQTEITQLWILFDGFNKIIWERLQSLHSRNQATPHNYK